jgi:type II secretory pathway pseudopilin PulG
MQIQKHIKAFTLLELLVVLGLLSSLIVMMMLSDGNNTQARRENTRNNINQVYQMFLNARNNALTSTTVVSDTAFTPQNGFGVNIKIDHANIGNSVFTLFADTDDGTEGDDGVGDNQYNFTVGGAYNDIKFGDFIFPLKDGNIVEFKGVKMDGILVDFLDESNNIYNVAILFRPPSAEVIITDDFNGRTYKSFFIEIRNEGVFGERLSLERAQRYIDRQRTFP